MKALINILFVMVATASLVGCGEKEKNRESIRGRSSGGRIPSTGGSGGGGTLKTNSDWPGTIIGSPQNAFQQATAGFVSAFMDPYELGTVSGSFNADTGIRFNGRVQFDRGFDPRGSTSYENEVRSGRLEILIVDSYAARGDAKPIVADGLELVDYYISGKNIELVFEDSLGTVTLEGAYDNQYFQGVIWYENYEHYDGGQGESWDWGSFYIPVCDFFVCK